MHNRKGCKNSFLKSVNSKHFKLSRDKNYTQEKPKEGHRVKAKKLIKKINQLSIINTTSYAIGSGLLVFLGLKINNLFVFSLGISLLAMGIVLLLEIILIELIG